MNSVPYISTKYCQGGMGGRGSKNSKFVQMSYVHAPLCRAPNDRLPFSLSNMTDCGGMCECTHVTSSRLDCSPSRMGDALSSQCVRGAFGFTQLERRRKEGEHSFCNVQDGQVSFHSEIVIHKCIPLYRFYLSMMLGYLRWVQYHFHVTFSYMISSIVCELNSTSKVVVEYADLPRP